jgi:hypothetical protein
MDNVNLDAKNGEGEANVAPSKKLRKVQRSLRGATPDPDPTPKAKADKPKLRTTRLSEEVILDEYPHAIPGTLHFLPEENKQAVQISCQARPGEEWDVDAKAWTGGGEKCGREREVRTSDLFQVSTCEVCTLKRRRAKAKARRKAANRDD